VSPAQLNITIRAMRIYGGGFAVKLADLLEVADQENEARLLAAFPDYVTRYGPGSDVFALVSGEVTA